MYWNSITLTEFHECDDIPLSLQNSIISITLCNQNSIILTALHYFHTAKRIPLLYHNSLCYINEYFYINEIQLF